MASYLALDNGSPVLVADPKQAARFVLVVRPGAEQIELREDTPLSPPQIALDVVCKHYGVSKADLLSKTRAARVCRARHILSYLLRQQLVLTWSEIGELLGRDHTTIIHGARKIQKQADKSAAIVVELRALASDIRAHAWSGVAVEQPLVPEDSPLACDSCCGWGGFEDCTDAARAAGRYGQDVTCEDCKGSGKAKGA